MTVTRIILAAAIAAISFPVLAAEAITVGYKNLVTPDPALLEFTEDIRHVWISAKRYDPNERDWLFAPVVKTFMKIETPLQPFEPRDDITSDYLQNAIFVFRARKGSIPDDQIGKYIPGTMSDIGRQVVRQTAWGTLPEVPGMVCAGAAFDLDPHAVAKFSRMHRVRIDRLVFSRQAIPLYAARNLKSEFLGNVPPYTLMAVGKDDVATEDWHPMIASSGIKGYMGEAIPLETLVQKHVCFAKVDGVYRITALFGYGF